MMRVAGVVVAVVAALALGLVVGVLGAFQHPTDLAVGGIRLPVGVVAGVAALLLAQVLAREAVPYGLGPALVLVGWTVTVSVLGTSRPEGDLVVPATATGSAFLYGGFLVGLVVAATLALRPASGATRPGR